MAFDKNIMIFTIFKWLFIEMDLIRYQLGEPLIRHASWLLCNFGGWMWTNSAVNTYVVLCYVSKFLLFWSVCLLSYSSTFLVWCLDVSTSCTIHYMFPEHVVMFLQVPETATLTWCHLNVMIHQCNLIYVVLCCPICLPFRMSDSLVACIDFHSDVART